MDLSERFYDLLRPIEKRKKRACLKCGTAFSTFKSLRTCAFCVERYQGDYKDRCRERKAAGLIK